MPGQEYSPIPPRLTSLHTGNTKGSAVMDLNRTTRSRAAREWARIAGPMALILATFSPSAQATTSFTNGTFAQSCTDGAGNGPQVTCTNGNGQLGYNTNVSGWVNTSVGYSFLFNSVT